MRGCQFAITAAALWAIASLGCAPVDEGLPAEMVGVWRTDSPAYADRYLELQPRFIAFGTGKHTIDLHLLVRVYSEPMSEVHPGRLYTLEYRGDGAELAELRLVHAPGPSASLRFANRQEVWTLEKPAQTAHQESRQ